MRLSSVDRRTGFGGPPCSCTYSVQYDDGISMAEVVCEGTPYRGICHSSK